MNITRSLRNLLRNLDIQDDSLLELLLDQDPDLREWWEDQQEIDRNEQRIAEEEVEAAMKLQHSLTEEEKKGFGL